MYETEMKLKLKDYFEKKGVFIEEEVSFNMNIEERGIELTNVLIVDLLITSQNRQQVAIECKTIKDAHTIGKIFGGVGQAFLYSKIFGWSYLALEVNEELTRKKREFWKRVVLTNVNQELKIGILVVADNVFEIEKPSFIYPEAATVFTRSKIKANVCGRCNRSEDTNLINQEGFPYEICDSCKKAIEWYWNPLS